MAWWDRLRRRRQSVMCRQAVELFTDYLEGALNTVDRKRLEAHLADCPHCTEYLRQLKLTIELAGHVEPEQLSEEARTDLVALYRQWKAG